MNMYNAIRTIMRTMRLARRIMRISYKVHHQVSRKKRQHHRNTKEQAAQGTCYYSNKLW